MNKTTIIILLALMLCIPAIRAEYTYIANSQVITASLVNQIPDPAVAGNTVELSIGIENYGGQAALGYNVELVPKYPIEKLPGETYIKNTGLLQGFQVNNEQKIIKFNVRTDKDATAGSYDFDILIYQPEEKDYATIRKTLSYDLTARESAEIIHIDKVELRPGQQTPLEFTITNVGSAPLRELSFSWSNANDAVLPVGSADKKYVKYLGVGEKITLTYDVMADTNAAPGLYKLDLKLAYEDPVTNTYTNITDHAGVYVGGGTDFDVAFSESTNGDTSFSVANVGSNPAYSVSVIIPKQDGWRVTGSNSAIIGNLDKGDYTVASFTLQPAMSSQLTQATTGAAQAQRTGQRDSSAGMTPDTVTVEVAYTDTMGKRLTVEKDVSVGASMDVNETGAFRAAGARTTVQQTSFFSQYKWYIIGIFTLFALYIARKKYKEYKLLNPKFTLSSLFRKK
ncbi:MAG: COG1361 S-layer family protein [Nanoarchaeota archaeon]|nr:COG1361 S-layer family protein [Nanoarchaeota archaeon]